MTEFFKNIRSQTLEKMVGIDIYEVDVTISIRLGYHRVDEAEKIASTIQTGDRRSYRLHSRRRLVAHDSYDVTGYMCRANHPEKIRHGVQDMDATRRCTRPCIRTSLTW